MAEAADISLGMPIDAVPGVTSKRAGALLELGVTNLGKLIAYLPMRHERLEAEAEVGQLGHDQSHLAPPEARADAMEPPAAVLSGRADSEQFDHGRHGLRRSLRNDDGSVKFGDPGASGRA